MPVLFFGSVVFLWRENKSLHCPQTLPTSYQPTLHYLLDTNQHKPTSYQPTLATSSQPTLHYLLVTNHIKPTSYQPLPTSYQPKLNY